ncbi:MAG TPA: hypothetical protein VIM71_00555 [Lacunisphaera sp.]
MSQFDQQWQKLTALARQAPAEHDPALPPGFATRIAARAVAVPSAGPWFNFERLALRGLLAAAACCAAAIAYNFVELSSDQTDIYATGTADAVIDLLDIS